MLHLLYIADENGSMIWHFVHPKIRTDFLEKIAGKDHAAITNLSYALAMFGYETIGSNLQVVVFENAKLIFRYIPCCDKKLLVVAVVDLLDHPKAVWEIIEELVREGREDIENLLSTLEKPVSEQEIEKSKLKLTRILVSLLESRVRKIKILATRDYRNTIAALIPSILFYFLMAGLTIYLHQLYINMPANLLAGLLVIFNFLIPSIFIGWVTGFRKGAVINSVIVTILSLYILAALWWNALVTIAYYIFGVTQETILVGIFVIGLILGEAMGLIARSIAWRFVESKTLIPIP